MATELEDLRKQAGEFFDHEKYKEIIDLLKDEVLERLKDAELYAWRARSHNEGEEDLNKRLFYAQKSIQVNPEYWMGYYAKGVAFYRNGEYDKAIEEYTKAIELKSDYALSYYNRGNAWYAKGQYDNAIDDFNKSIKLEADYADAYLSRGNAWSDKKDFGKAIDDFNKVIELKPDYAIAYCNRGNAWHYSDQYNKAIDDYTKAIELKPSYVEAYSNRGNSLYSNKEYDKAIEDCNKAIELNQDYSNAYINRGNAWKAKGEIDKSIEDYTKAIELKSDSAIAYYNRGNAWSVKHELDRAIEDYTKAIEFKLFYAEAYGNRGITWSEKGEDKKAIDDFNEAIRLKHDYTDAYNNRGYSFYLLQDYDRAIADFDKVLTIDPTHSLAKNNRANALYKLEELQKEASIKATNVRKDLADRMTSLKANATSIVDSIRSLASSNVKTVVHYTKIFVAEIYIKNVTSKMHYSNAIYMNDPMEGKVLFDFFKDGENNDEKIKEAYYNGERRTETSVYLGSFLPAEAEDGSASHEDELVMWRTYGKDEINREAAGCNVILDCNFFKSLTSDKEAKQSIVPELTQNLLNVVYIKKSKGGQTITNDPQGKIKPALNNLKKILLDMIRIRDGEKNKNNEFVKEVDNVIFSTLSTITYLFKSADYEYEHEARVITYRPRSDNSILARNVTEPGKPPLRLFIESENFILPYIKKIYLGPKVENHQQWSLYFDFELRRRVKELKESPSVPYALNPNDIEIVKSECLFQ